MNEVLIPAAIKIQALVRRVQSNQQEDWMKRFRANRIIGRKCIQVLNQYEQLRTAREELAKEKEENRIIADRIKKKAPKNAPKPKQFRFLSSRPRFITASI